MKPLLILPVENQVRELDAKLLVAVLGVQRGHRSVIGWKNLIDRRIGRFPPSIYFAKSLSQQNTKMLRIKRRLGHCVVAWDEEAVVHYPKDIYYVRRLGNDALALVDVLVAWGEDNRELWAGHPSCPVDAIRVLGNPRADLLRPEMRDLFADRQKELRERYGRYILVNTNFGSVNGYSDLQNLLRQDPATGEWVRGRGSLGMPMEFAQGLFDYRSKVFAGFQQLLPELAARFPDRQIVLRPHPAESHDFWKERMAPFANVAVTGEGNVVPWLMAADCLIHNGCTTAVEGFLLGTPVISFVPEDDDRYEFQLPNLLGVRCKTADDVARNVVHREADAASRAERQTLVERFIRIEPDSLAAQRVLDALPDRPPRNTPLRLPTRWVGRAKAEWRSWRKERQRKAGGARYSDGFMRQRFPELSAQELQGRANRMVRITGGTRAVRIIAREPDLFEVTHA